MCDVSYRVVSALDLAPHEVSAWSELQHADRAVDSPFFRPEYAAAVGTACGNVEITIMERGGSPVGFFPFQRSRSHVGRAIAAPMSDMNGVIAAPGLQWTAEELLRQSGLSTWHFDHLIASQVQFQHHHFCIDDSPYMDLRHGFATYQEERARTGSSLLNQAGRKSRKLAREVGPLRFELHSRDATVVSRLIEWKRRQLRQAHQVDVFRSPWLLSLIEVILGANTEGLSGQLSTLHAGDHLVSIHLGIRSHHVLAAWIPTFDAGFRKYSPGLLLHLELARRAAEQGIERIDLGRGGNRMKSSLASGAIPVAVGLVERRRVRRQLWRYWYAARRTARASPLQDSLKRLYRMGRNWIARP